jgi:hypothetical protein
MAPFAEPAKITQHGLAFCAESRYILYCIAETSLAEHAQMGGLEVEYKIT